MKNFTAIVAVMTIMSLETMASTSPLENGQTENSGAFDFSTPINLIDLSYDQITAQYNIGQNGDIFDQNGRGTAYRIIGNGQWEIKEPEKTDDGASAGGLLFEERIYTTWRNLGNGRAVIDTRVSIPYSIWQLIKMGALRESN